MLRPVDPCTPSGSLNTDKCIHPWILVRQPKRTLVDPFTPTSVYTRVSLYNGQCVYPRIYVHRPLRILVDPYTSANASGSGIAQWLERWTRDWKVAGLNPCRSGGRIFFSRVNFVCWLLFRYPFHPRITAVARKRSRSFCQKCRWQVTAKHAYILPRWLWRKWHCNLVHGWMVYTKLAPKRQHFTWHQPCNNHRTLPVHHFRGY